jgi:hypothetical protein
MRMMGISKALLVGAVVIAAALTACGSAADAYPQAEQDQYVQQCTLTLMATSAGSIEVDAKTKQSTNCGCLMDEIAKAQPHKKWLEDGSLASDHPELIDTDTLKAYHRYMATCGLSSESIGSFVGGSTVEPEVPPATTAPGVTPARKCTSGGVEVPC